MILVGPMALVMLSGGLDFSTAGVAVLASMVTALCLGDGMSPEMTFLYAMLAAGGVGLLHGILVSVALVNPVILTLLSMLLLASGTPFFLGDQYTIEFGQNAGFIKDLHNSPIVLAVSAGVSMLLIQLAQIRGGACGLPVSRQSWTRRTFCVCLPYVLCSLAAGIVGSSLAASTGRGSRGASDDVSIFVVLAALLGGNCTGRRFGTVIGAAVGVAIFAAMQNLLLMEGTEPDTILFILACAAAGGLLLSQLVYGFMNLLYRKSRVKRQAMV
jgi:ribose transport system permease protein